MENFATLLRPSAKGLKGSVKSALNIYSRKIKYEDFVEIFETLDQGEKVDSMQRNNEAMIATIKEVTREFDPVISVDIKEFFFKSFKAKDAKANIRFEEGDVLYLDNTGFTYANGKVDLNASMNLSNEAEIPFSAGLSTGFLEIEELMKTFDFFGLEALRQAEKVEG